MSSVTMREKASAWLYNPDYPNECASMSEVEDLAALLDEVRDECLRELADAIGVGRYVYGNEVRAYAVKLERGVVKPAL